MRLLTAAILSAALISTAVIAQTQPANPGVPPVANNSRSFGSATCRQAIPCSTSDTNSVIAIANSCVATYFGYTPPTDDGGFFDSFAGLDASGCLASKSNVIPKGVGLQLSPVCCIIPSPDSGADSNSCKLHCNLMSVPAGR